MQSDMTRVNRILAHPLFREKTAQIEELEKDRIFCRHGMEHLLAVARLSYIYNLEENLHISKELIYAVALLHDIGRGEQYLSGVPHDRAGLAWAGTVLTDCGFSQEEKERVLTAIGCHRSPEIATERNLSGILYRADKESRPCFCCPAAALCNWPEEKRNHGLRG